MFKTFFKRDSNAEVAKALYAAAVQQARQPRFYLALGVPDSLDGRYDMVALHVYLILDRLKRAPGEGDALAQALFDAMFEDFDVSLREMGAGDIGVGPRVKKMAQGFYGRMAAYDAAIAGEGDPLPAVLRRNVYGTVSAPDPASTQALSDYVMRERRTLAAQETAEIARGRVRFGPPPEAPAASAPAATGYQVGERGQVGEGGQGDEGRSE